MSPINNNPDVWRSSGELEGSAEFTSHLHREFQEGASVLEDPISRRTFVKLMGATAAFAGLAGCTFRKPKQSIFPYVKTPEDLTVGKSTYYATSMSVGEDVVGLLVESFEGRPIKVEGNPSHPESLGAAKSWQQASVLELYDPDRVKTPQQKGQAVGREAFEAGIVEWMESTRTSQGKGLAILTETYTSPTFDRLLTEIKKKMPLVQLYRYSPVNEDLTREAVRQVTGEKGRLAYHFESAAIVASFEADFLGTDNGNILYTKQFMYRRDPDHELGMNRFYAVESRYSLTGGKADHRLRLKPSQVEAALVQLASSLQENGVAISSDLDGIKSRSEKVMSARFVAALTEDLIKNRGKSLVVVGQGMSVFAQSLGILINKGLGNIGSTLAITALPFQSAVYEKNGLESISEFAEAIKTGEIESAILIGGNPVYTAPLELKLEKRLASLKNSLHLSLFVNETSNAVQWVVPREHYLESWGDSRSLNGTTAIVQPLIQPLYDSVSDIEMLGYCLNDARKGYEFVRETWSATTLSEITWKKWLHEGVISSEKSLKSLSVSTANLSALKPAKSSKAIEISFYPDYSIYDGSFANNGWLQELPNPITKLTWDNVAMLSKKTAESKGVKTGDVVEITSGPNKLEVPVMIVPGHADSAISIALGYGRKVVGRVGEKAGFNAYSLMAAGVTGYATATLTRTGKTYPLASTQEHHSLEGRAVYRTAELDAYKKDPDFAKKQVEHPPLLSSWEEKKYETGPQWGMVIDLNKCTGCSACITACQSENNIPIVGKKQVMNSREMHWIRIDRYFEGAEDSPGLIQQPVTCLQCEMAPCEQVCPVAATTHSEEGLNEMTYNRCVGTRYCANNCPVKVRRFNFFDFHQRNPQAVVKDRIHFFDYFKEPDKTVQMQFNPDVTVRMRGIMEKCTYCVQRINEAKFTAKNEDRSIKDGEIKTACQQTCPSEAIVFGDILDENSKVAKLKKHHRDYHMLAELNLKPRTSYLAGVRNPHPKLEVGRKLGNS